MSSPRYYPEAAPALRAAGYSPMPLPEGAKFPPPDGWTGRGAPMASGADVQTWADDPRHARANTAVRLPERVIGLDVDNYDGKPGADTVRALRAEHGAPPATWIVSSRSDGASGIRLYLLPDGVDEADLAGGLPGVDMIRHGHRYMLAPGSVHPSGDVYRCWHAATREEVDGLPDVGALPVLPEAWARAFTRARRAAERVESRHRALTEGRPCQAVTAALSRALDDLGSGGSRHDATVEAVARVLRLGDQGHEGAGRAVDELRAAYVEAVAEPRVDASGTVLGPALPARRAVTSYADMLGSGLHLIDEEPTPDEDRRCCGTGSGAAPTLIEVPDGWDPDRPAALAYLIDWPTAYTSEDRPVDWLVEGIVERGRQVAIYSAAKAGKSLLLLDLAASLATGRPVLGMPPTGERVPVLYCDYENTPGDTVDRLRDLGYADPDELDELHYLSLPSLPSLDTPAGGEALLAAAQAVGAHLTIVDTASRTIAGPEDASDTWLAWYTSTGMRFKRAGVALVRLDHSGKDPKRGQRGSSAKVSDVDLVLLLVADGDRLELIAQERRQAHYSERTSIRRHEVGGVLRHQVTSATEAADEATRALAAWLDEQGVPREAGRPTVKAVLAERGHPATKRTLEAAIRLRKSLPKVLPEGRAAGRAAVSGQTPGTGAHPEPGSSGQQGGQAPGSTGQRLHGDTGPDCPPDRLSIETGSRAAGHPEQAPHDPCRACGEALVHGDLLGDGLHPTCHEPEVVA